MSLTGLLCDITAGLLCDITGQRRRRIPGVSLSGVVPKTGVKWKQRTTVLPTYFLSTACIATSTFAFFEIRVIV